MSAAHEERYAGLMGQVNQRLAAPTRSPRTEPGDVLDARSGGSSSFGSDRYFPAFFGEPDLARRFTVRFGGHHVVVTTTYENGTVSPTPAFPGDDGGFPAPGGVPAAELTAAQRGLVVAAARAWVGDADERVAAVLLRRYEADFDRTRIAWAGSPDPDVAGAYLRIDGPRLWIEPSTQSRTGNGDTVHYHSVYRDRQTDSAGA